MNAVSALLRIGCGAAVLFLTWSTWSRNREALSGDGPVTVYGQTMSGSTVGLACGVFALIGLGLLALGVMGLLKGSK